MAKLQSQQRKAQPKLATNQSQTLLKVRVCPPMIEFLAENFFLQLVYLADNLQQILLAKEVETAKQRRRAQWQVVKK